MGGFELAPGIAQVSVMDICMLTPKVVHNGCNNTTTMVGNNQKYTSFSTVTGDFFHTHAFSLQKSM